jgi:lysozyme family protein
MSSFGPAIAVVLRHEGGWVDDPDDLGGETNYGISSLIIKRENISPAYLGLNPDTQGQRGWLRPLSVEAASRVYERLFWDRYGYKAILDQTVATKVFDCAVNCGPARAHAMAQRAAAVVSGAQVTADGIMGPKTIAAINACQPAAFVAAFAQQMRNHYEAIIQARPQNAKFRANWLRRAAWGTS